MTETRTIRVTGRSRIRVRPDMTRITMTLEGKYPDYGETLRRSSEDTEKIRSLLADFGFDRSDLKTLSFNVDTEYESYQYNGTFRQHFVGYRFRHMMKVEFDSDNDRLGKVLYALAHCPVGLEFRISYTVRDPEAVKNALLYKAVADAKEKASVLTKAAGVMLKDIRSIDYPWGQSEFEIRPMSRMLRADDSSVPMATGAGCYDMDIEPDEIDVSDTVNVIWAIE